MIKGGGVELLKDGRRRRTETWPVRTGRTQGFGEKLTDSKEGF
jgi:hypothetical protein